MSQPVFLFRLPEYQVMYGREKNQKISQFGYVNENPYQRVSNCIGSSSESTHLARGTPSNAPRLIWSVRPCQSSSIPPSAIEPSG